MGLERRASGSEQLLLLKRTPVRVTAPLLGGLQPPASGDLTPQASLNTCTCTCMHMCINKNQIILKPPLIREKSSTSFYEKMAFTDLGLTDLAKPAGQAAPVVSLALPPQCWYYKHEPLQLAFFMWVLGIEPRSSSLCGKYFTN